MRHALRFTANVSIEHRGDYWAAYIEPPGMTVYGDTESAAIGRIIRAMDFFKNEFATGNDGVQKLRAYLDAHGVPSLVTTDVVQDDAATRIEYPVDFRMEVAAGA